MSRGARWVLGTASLLFSFSFAISIVTDPSPKVAPLYGAFAFCILIAVACFSTRLRPLAVRLIGASVFGLYLWYLISEVATAQNHLQESHWGKAAIGFAIFGLPGLYVAVFGNFPWWGLGAEVFSDVERSSKPNVDDSIQ